MTIQLFDLAGKDDSLKFGPYCWRSRMSLLHKGLHFDSVAWRFLEKDRIAESGNGTVPVITDNGKWVSDSWNIAMYLDETYPDRPMLMKDAESRAHARLVIAMTAAQVLPAAVPIALFQVYNLLDEDNQVYFRETREKALGKPLEAFQASPEEGRAGLAKGLSVFETLLGSTAYIGGDTPTFADYALFGVLKWIDIVSSYRAIDDESAVGKWFGGLEAMYDNHAASVPTVRSR